MTFFLIYTISHKSKMWMSLQSLSRDKNFMTQGFANTSSALFVLHHCYKKVAEGKQTLWTVFLSHLLLINVIDVFDTVLGAVL